MSIFNEQTGHKIAVKWETQVRIFICVGYMITYRKKNLSTPAATLASEHNYLAVDFLRQHGADINSIAYGYALGGKIKQGGKVSDEAWSKS